MTPDQHFARLVRVALVVFAVCFCYFLAADLWMPMTPQARVMHPVVRVAPEVGGRVVTVSAANNQHVAAGESLFTLDRRPYRLAVEDAALALEEAQRDNAQLDASITAAKATLAANRADADELRQDMARAERLIAQHSISRQDFDQARASDQAAQAQVQAAQAEVDALQAQRGGQGDDNLRLRRARNALAKARLDLEYTSVEADISGTVSNLQVSAGDYANAGSPMLALVSDEADVIADFREKTLRSVHEGDAASVIFDAYPGRVFDARVVGRDAGVKDGQLQADGSLADPKSSDRWVRDAQRQRLHLELDDAPGVLARLPSGARATVQLHPVGGLAAWLGALQARLVSLIHFIY